MPLIVAPRCGVILCTWCADMGADADDCGADPFGPPAMFYRGDAAVCASCGAGSA